VRIHPMTDTDTIKRYLPWLVATALFMVKASYHY
jgi:hypothetical protein